MRSEDLDMIRSSYKTLKNIYDIDDIENIYEMDREDYKMAYMEAKKIEVDLKLPWEIMNTLMLIPWVQKLLDNPQDEVAYSQVEILINYFEKLKHKYPEIRDYYNNIASTAASVGGSV